LKKVADISSGESSRDTGISLPSINIPLAPYVVRPTMEHFDPWWQYSFDPQGVHPTKLKQQMYNEWEVFNALPHLAYLSLLNTGQTKRAVAMARFVFINSRFIDHVKTLSEGHINTHIMGNVLPTGENIRLSVEEFNKQNDPNHGLSCMISARDIYKGVHHDHAYDYLSDIFSRFMKDVAGWQIRHIVLTTSDADQISLFESQGFRKIHTLHTEGKDHFFMMLNRESAYLKKSLFSPVFNATNPVIKFSLQERKVLYLSLYGMSSAEIAHLLKLKAITIDTYKKNTRKRFQKFLHGATLSDLANSEVPSFDDLKDYLYNHPEEIRIVLPRTR
jgi:Bacterial regulatory proteins, luxR family